MLFRVAQERRAVYAIPVLSCYTGLKMVREIFSLGKNILSLSILFYNQCGRLKTILKHVFCDYLKSI